ncbi:hypothetical protein [Parasphingorhabdus flavimaris]|jgi:hypothetical protein|nr:hypothetical protein [Parasphingorhabdus flavimaris]|tara:strand:- start:48125 stop:48250 length:126 start_codon:yes stop_codon:yes gene_type:complete
MVPTITAFESSPDEARPAFVRAFDAQLAVFKARSKDDGTNL